MEIVTLLDKLISAQGLAVAILVALAAFYYFKLYPAKVKRDEGLTAELIASRMAREVREQSAREERETERALFLAQLDKISTSNVGAMDRQSAAISAGADRNAAALDRNSEILRNAVQLIAQGERRDVAH